MYWLGVLGVALILAAAIGMGTMSDWGMHGPWMRPGGSPGPSSMPHMGWGSDSGTGTAPSPVAGARQILVGLVDFAFRPAEVRIKAGDLANLQIANRGGILHDLTIPALGIRAVVAPGQQVTFGVQPQPAGTYEFYCSVPGHREAGMVGRLVVEP